MLLYVSGPYSGEGEVESNIAQARKVAIALWEKGHAVIVPHLNTAHMEKDCKATYDQFLAGDLMMIARCDGMVMAPDWEFSKGAKIEYEYAESLKLPVWEYPDLPDLHPSISDIALHQLFSDIAGQTGRQPCGHPVACIISTGEGTHHCGWCASEHKWDGLIRLVQAWADAKAAHVTAIGNNEPESITGLLWITLVRCNLDLYNAITHRR